MYNTAPVRLLGPLLFLFLLATGCKKFLDAKPDKKLAVPATLRDMQLLLDNYALFNAQYPAGAEVGADDYYLTPAVWAALPNEAYRNNYLWLPDGTSTTDWSPAYQRIYNANVILEEVAGISYRPNEVAQYNSIRGSALFLRAYYYFGLSQLFIKPYEEATAGQDPGLPLRIDPDFSKPSVRATVQQTYERIIADFQEAIPLLPASPAIRSRPSKWAAYAALARVFLSMRQYGQALLYADSCLQGFNTLLDYNTQSSTAAFPFPLLNAEVIFDAGALPVAPLTQSRWRADSLLYASYAAADLRKSLFYKSNGDGSYTFKGSYQGSATPFSGFAADEVYFIRAEGRARAGQTALALDDLNAVLKKRWRTGAFVPFTAASAADALTLILAERRKELVFRTLRWTDLRRFSLQAGTTVTPRRVINNTVYQLSPGSLRYVLRIPQAIIDLSGIGQNP